MACNARLLTSVAVAISFLSWSLSILSFFLPYWVYVDETLVAPKRWGTTNTVHIRYNYGFWKYCSTLVTSTTTSHICGNIVSHEVWEQVAVCLVLLAAILQLNSILKGSLFLLIFDTEPLCLYVAGSSAGVAGLLLLTVAVTFGTNNRTILELTDTYTVPFKISHLHASYWCAAASGIISFVLSIVFFVATVNISPTRFENRAESDSTSVRSGRSRFRRRTDLALEMSRTKRYNTFKDNEEIPLSLYSLPVYNNAYFESREQLAEHIPEQNKYSENNHESDPDPSFEPQTREKKLGTCIAKVSCKCRSGQSSSIPHAPTSNRESRYNANPNETTTTTDSLPVHPNMLINMDKVMKENKCNRSESFGVLDESIKCYNNAISPSSVKHENSKCRGDMNDECSGCPSTAGSARKIVASPCCTRYAWVE